MQWQEHWDKVYHAKREDEVSWFESLPATSLRMLEAAGLTVDTCVIDIGGGDSRLVDHLAARGLDCLAVLDVSGAALQRARSRLGTSASIPIWIEADVAGAWSFQPMDIWHDRAVFHFLIDPDARSRYRSHLLRVLKPGGAAIVATFALGGPTTCSGLHVQRYAPETLASEMGPALDLVETVEYVHATPWGSRQPFLYCRFRKVG